MNEQAYAFYLSLYPFLSLSTHLFVGPSVLPSVPLSVPLCVSISLAVLPCVYLPLLHTWSSCVPPSAFSPLPLPSALCLLPPAPSSFPLPSALSQLLSASLLYCVTVTGFHYDVGCTLFGPSILLNCEQKKKFFLLLFHLLSFLKTGFHYVGPRTHCVQAGLRDSLASASVS